MKSQISIEFMTGVAIMLFIYITTLGIYSSYAQTNLIENEIAQEICYKAATGISSAVVGGDGFATNVTIPYQVQTQPYVLFATSNESLLTVDWPNGIFACSVISQNITGRHVYPEKFSANNINGVVYLTSIATDQLQYSQGETVQINGSYFFNNVTLNIIDENGNAVSGFPKEIETINNTFQHNWTAASSGFYEIIGFDKIRKSLYAERAVIIT